MSISVKQRYNICNVLEVSVSGRPSGPDYECLGRLIDQVVRDFGKIRLLLDLTEFDDWDLRSFWQDIRFACRHFADLSRVAIVGSKRSVKTLSVLCQWLIGVQWRYFDGGDKKVALAWVDSPNKESLARAIALLRGNAVAPP